MFPVPDPSHITEDHLNWAVKLSDRPWFPWDEIPEQFAQFTGSVGPLPFCYLQRLQEFGDWIAFEAFEPFDAEQFQLKEGLDPVAVQRAILAIAKTMPSKAECAWGATAWLVSQWYDCPPVPLMVPREWSVR